MLFSVFRATTKVYKFNPNRSAATSQAVRGAAAPRLPNTGGPGGSTPQEQLFAIKLQLFATICHSIICKRFAQSAGPGAIWWFESSS